MKRLLIVCVSVVSLVVPASSALAVEQCVEIVFWRDCI